MPARNYRHIGRVQIVKLAQQLGASVLLLWTQNARNIWRNLNFLLKTALNEIYGHFIYAANTKCLNYEFEIPWYIYQLKVYANLGNNYIDRHRAVATPELDKNTAVTKMENRKMHITT